ncbi:ribbon-helix-helix domain-containing protein [Zavarzinia sp.]|uniref:ribbon-helix-helix domain-containing protein n=1 Tax=Zavarzinia sp. TaxID=2027920 RepID=UPI0035665CDD
MRNVKIKGHRTSVRLEPTLWDAIEDICLREGVGLDDLCTRVATERPGNNFTSNLRCWVVDYFRGNPAAA